MRERPILFSGPMVRAILDGRKTQTRRVIRNPGRLNGLMMAGEEGDWCPYGRAGDRLWVRAGFRVEYSPARNGYRIVLRDVGASDWHVDVDADWCSNKQWKPVEGTGMKSTHWIPPIHVPRWASRLTLEVVAVRVERLQEISDDDALAEGADGPQPSSWHPDAGEVGPPSYRDGFRELWDSINAKRGHSWDSNPWVWVIEFAPLGSESAGKE